MAKRKQDGFEVKDERRPGFSIIDNIFIDEYGPLLGAYGIAAYCILARFANRQGTDSWPSYRTVGYLMGASRRTAIYAIQKLVDFGLIRKDSRSVNGESTTNIYTLLSVTKLQGSHVVGGACDAPPGACDAPPGACDAPPGACDAPDQDTNNKTPITRHLDQNDDDALAFPSVKEDRSSVRSARADQGHPETEALRLAAHRFAALAFPNGGFDNLNGYIANLSAEQLRSFCAFCYLSDLKASRGETGIKDHAAFVHGMAARCAWPDFGPVEAEQFEQRMANYMIGFEADVWEEFSESEYIP